MPHLESHFPSLDPFLHCSLPTPDPHPSLLLGQNPTCPPVTFCRLPSASWGVGMSPKPSHRAHTPGQPGTNVGLGIWEA